MAIERYDLNKCIGCRQCINICPMDVFRFSEEANKSIIAYPENCQACGMCYYACLGASLQISLHSHMFPVVPMSATCGIDANHFINASPDLANVEERLGKYGEYASEPKLATAADLAAPGPGGFGGQAPPPEAGGPPGGNVPPGPRP